MVVTWQTIITLGAVISAIVAIFKQYNKAFSFVEHQKEQDADIKSIKEEQEILTRGMLACLKGLSEQGCDGPVSQGIVDIEEYLNRKAHR